MTKATPFTIDELCLSAFRAYLVPKSFDFKRKRCLALFAPNGYGKSSVIDALEFLFSDEGTLERLGVRRINNKAGIEALAHNLAVEKQITPFVKVRFSKDGSHHDGVREIYGIQRTRPAIVDEVLRHRAVDPIIRGYALRHFVEKETAEERYQHVARWLQLGPLVDAQKRLRGLRQQIKAMVEDNTGLAAIDRKLAKKTSNTVRAWDEKEILSYAKKVIAALDKELVPDRVDPEDHAFITVNARAKAEIERLGLKGLQQLRQSAVALYEPEESPDTNGVTTRGLLPEFAAAAVSYAAAVEFEERERQITANATFAKLWEAAEPLFKVDSAPLDTCPICLTRIEDSVAGTTQEIGRHIAEQRVNLSAYAATKKTLADAKKALVHAHASVVVAVKTIQPLLTEGYDFVCEPLQSYLVTVKSWKQGEIPSDETLCPVLEQLTKNLDKQIRDLLESQGEGTYTAAKTQLDGLIELKEEREFILQTRHEMMKIMTELNDQAAFISSKIREKVQTLLDTLQVPVNDLYRQIQGPDSAVIRLELPPEDDVNQQRLNLVVDFAKNRKGVQPSGYLSDSQVHSLALALRLAAIKRFNIGAPIVALDDVVTSYDADHRRSIAALLANKFATFQIIVVTHDERFFLYLKDQLDDVNWQYKRIYRLDSDFGPRFSDHRVADEEIEDKWKRGESAANEIRQAEEEWLLLMCRDFGTSVRIRALEKPYSYERNELASSLAALLKKQGLIPPQVPGVNNRFLESIQQGVVENFGSHFQDAPYSSTSLGDEKTRWREFTYFRNQFICPACSKARFKRPFELKKPVCAADGCEAQFSFASQSE